MRWIAVAAAGVVMLLMLGGAAVIAVAMMRRAPLDEAAIVRVVSGSGTGTGFFVAPPKGQDGVLVVTAFHVVDSGKQVTVERVRSEGKQTYLEAYPETEIVAFDADADLAIVRVKNLPRSKVQTLDLADSTVKDEPLVSAGFPSSSFTSRVGLLKKEGKLLDTAKLPVVDRAYGRVLRENAIDGLIVSNDVEPGFSGGPTVNARGDVVGVNVLKDNIHRGQNGAVAAAVVRDLIAQVKPMAAPTAADVEALLRKVQDQHLLLPVDDRAKVNEHDLIASSDLPQLRSLITEIRGMEQDVREHDFAAGMKASNRALLGILLARLPGKSLETYTASSTQEGVRKCEDTARGIRKFLGELDGVAREERESDCVRLATRPLAWDLTAVTLEWAGTPREYGVTKIDEVDADAHVFRASVRMSGLPSLVPVHVAAEGGRLRLKLFDKTGRLHALDGTRGAVGRDFEGTWVSKRERRADPAMAGVEAESEEKLIVTIAGTDSVSIAHQFKTSRFAAKPGVRFSCNQEPQIVSSGSQSLSGKLHNGVITGSRPDAVQSAARGESGGDGCTRCGLCMTPHKLFVLKLHAGRLMLYRTNGVNAPELVELTRE
jgi:hypothetical protein